MSATHSGVHSCWNTAWCGRRSFPNAKPDRVLGWQRRPGWLSARQRSIRIEPTINAFAPTSTWAAVDDPVTKRVTTRTGEMTKTTFTLATPPGPREPSVRIEIECWSNAATVAQRVTKHRRVIVDGHLVMSTYTSTTSPTASTYTTASAPTTNAPTPQHDATPWLVTDPTNNPTSTSSAPAPAAAPAPHRHPALPCNGSPRPGRTRWVERQPRQRTSWPDPDHRDRLTRPQPRRLRTRETYRTANDAPAIRNPQEVKLEAEYRPLKSKFRFTLNPRSNNDAELRL